MGFWNCKRFVGAALAVLALSMIATAQVSGNRPDFAHDRVLVKLSANFLARSPAAAASEPDIGVSISSLRLLNPSRETSNVTALARASANGRHNNIYVLTLKETGEEAVKNALERLNANPAVEIAEPVFYRRLLRTPNDPMFDLQYALDRLNAQQAWEITTGSRDIIVGIIDTGIDGAHPDLVDNLWINPNPNQNGYVNDIHGYNFADRMGGIPTDNMSSHGTHVAGIIGARGDNGVGITGINWTVSLAWLGVTEKDSPNSEMSTDRVIEAINYATIHGMHVLNNSYGGAGSSQLELETIRNFPGVFVAAAGNESSNNDFTLSYPANYDSPNVISVASTDARDMLSNFSNYGVSVHIAAPGGRILSTVRDGEYHEFSGTSMATPYVAGVAALVMAARPNYTPAQVREILLASMSRVPALDGFGFGIVDAHAAVTGSLDNLYSITYNFGYDGRGPVVRQTISGMEPVAIMPPIREGYAFAGWYTSSTGGTAFNFTEALTDNATVYARWVEISDGMYAAVFPDANFRGVVLRAFNARLSLLAEILEEIFTPRLESTVLTEDDFDLLSRHSTLYAAGAGIKDVTGLEYLTGLTELDLNDNLLTELDVSGLSELRILKCADNWLTELDVSELTNLALLECGENRLTELDVNANTKLRFLMCSGNELTELDVSNNPMLSILECDRNELTALDVSNNPNLSNLDCSYNRISVLNVSGNPELESLNCADNLLTELDVGGNPLLTELIVYKNLLTVLDVTSNPQLENLNVLDNRLTALDVSNNPELWFLAASNNAIREIDVSGNGLLRNLSLSNCGLTALDLSNNPELRTLDINDNMLEEIDVSGNSLLRDMSVSNNRLTVLDFSNNASLTHLDCSKNRLTGILDLSANVTLIDLDCHGNYLTGLKVIEYHLAYLNCSYNAMENESAVEGFTGIWDGVNFIFSPQGPVSVNENNREIPKNDVETESTVIPATVAAGFFTFGPNPVAQSSKNVDIYRHGKRVTDGTLTLFDVSGNTVKHIYISDGGDTPDESARIVGSWNLTDRRGNPINAGTYLLRGTVTVVDGSRERVSLLIGVR